MALLMLTGGPSASATTGPPTFAPSVSHAAGGAPNPFPAGMAASLVLAQSDLATNASRGGPRGLSNLSYAAAMDARGDLWVADYGDNRVLEFSPPFTDDQPPALTLGQSTPSGTAPGTSARNLSAPDGLAFDPSGDLWVADFGNNRVVEFSPPFSSGMAARAVLGQVDFTGSAPGIGPRNFSGPAGLAFNGTTLWVCDYYSNRVLAFDAPIRNGSAATFVLGQANLTGYLGGLSADNLSKPAAVAVDAAGDVWVSDSDNDRVIEYLAPIRSNESASVVLGERDLSSRGARGPSTLASPEGLAFDARGDLWVADTGHNRTVEFRAGSLIDGATPATVLGQRNLTTRGVNATAVGENAPTAVAFDSAGDAWVVDAGNRRVLDYAPAQFALTFVPSGLPAPDLWSLRVGTSFYNRTAPATVALSVTNGTYDWNLTGAPPGFQAVELSGNVTVNGSARTVAIEFRPFSYRVSFDEIGLLPGTNWTIVVGNSSVRSSQISVVVNLTNGTYAFGVPGVGGYRLLSGNGSFTVAGRPQTISVEFDALIQSHPAPPIATWVYADGGILLALGIVGLFALVRAVRRTTRRDPDPSSDEPPPGGPA